MEYGDSVIKSLADSGSRGLATAELSKSLCIYRYCFDAWGEEASRALDVLV
jgi:hypothetical protein